MSRKSLFRARKTIVYFVTEDWYFVSHRLHLAAAARREGYDVHVITRVNQHRRAIEESGLRIEPITLSRRSTNPFTELRTIWQLIEILRRVKPDVLHNVAIKPVLYGAIAARVAGVPATVSALAGLGYLFSSQTHKTRLARRFIQLLFRIFLNGPGKMVIVQNPDDRKLLRDSGVIREDNLRIILGSGVDVDEFGFVEQSDDIPIVVLASRLLWDKGVGEFVNAARMLKSRAANARFVLVGDGDEENPSSITRDQLVAWQKEGVVEWWGRRDDMPVVLAQSHVVCLPSSYGEGVPKVLIEAASVGRPIVTYDVPGCREIVMHERNGLLVKRNDVCALAEAISRLLESPALRRSFGFAGRAIVLENFSLNKVIDDTFAVYDEVAK